MKVDAKARSCCSAMSPKAQLLYYRVPTEKADSRLRELNPAARGSQDVGSRYLGPTFFYHPCNVFPLILGGKVA